MNFLSHDYVLPDNSPGLTRVGSALPDLWPLLPKRPLPLVVLRKLKSGDEPARLLAAGIDSHMRSDAAFHGHPEFLRRVELLTPRVASAWPGLRHAGIAAHVLVEMLLDRWLMREEPKRLDTYYAAFTHDIIEFASVHTAADTPSSEALRKLLRMFVDSSFLRDYHAPAGLAHRFLRTLGRTPFGASPPPVESIAEWIDDADAELAEGSRGLLEAMRLS